MASRWLRWPRRPPDEAEHDAALTQLTAAFLDMDGRQSAAEAAVAAAAALSERADLSDEWATVRNACYEAAAAYLAVTDRTSEATPTPGAPGAARDLAAEIVRTADLLESARDGLDEFYDHHRRLLDAAVSNAAAVSTDADAALRGAHDVRQLLAGAEARYLEYPSVAAAREELDVATTRLTTARERDELAPTRAAIDGVRQATGAVREALSAAPEREGEAHRAVMSVRTRLDAVSTRTAGLS